MLESGTVVWPDLYFGAVVVRVARRPQMWICIYFYFFLLLLSSNAIQEADVNVWNNITFLSVFKFHECQFFLFFSFVISIFPPYISLAILVC